MKRILPGILCLIAVAMSCEIPQSLTIKGNPGVYIPLGKFSSFFEGGESIADYLSIAKIREMMGDTGTAGMTLYDYRGPDVPSGVQAFLIHYPITEMTLDLSKYINEAMENAETDFSYPIPDLDVEGFPVPPDDLEKLFEPGGYYENGCFIIVDENGVANLSPAPGTPLFTIPLGDMATLLKSVTGDEGAFGLVLTDYNPSFEEALRIRIPALGIDEYIQGEKKDNTLVFANDKHMEFNPQENKELKIYVKFVKPCEGTIEPEVIINWKEAVIDTSDIGSISGNYEIENISGGFLGDNVRFKDVRGYIYVGGGIGDQASMTLTLGNNSSPLVNDNLKDVERPSFSDPFSEKIPENSLLDKEYIPLTDVLNAQEASTLEYKISIEEMTLTSEEMKEEEIKIFADLVILITLEFEIEDDLSLDAPDGYVKPDFGNVLSELLEEDKDIFMRESNDDDLFNSFDWVEIALTKIENNIFNMDILSILVVNTGPDEYSSIINFGDSKPSLRINIDELPFPFIPKFEILLKKDNGKEYATLQLLRNDAPVFDFFLTARAKTAINETIPLF